MSKTAGYWFSPAPSEVTSSRISLDFDLRAADLFFRELVVRFPDSKYVPDAKLRMQFLINTLSRSDIRVASYYLRRGAYIAAINRANTVLKEFPQTRQTRDALQIMILAYDAMGQKDLRDDTQRVLDLNIAKDGVKPSVEATLRSGGSWWQFWL